MDLDQFIAAVEVLRHPELRGRPVVVGGDGDPTKRGVVSTASYEAREHGVHSGLPLRTAARRLPDAVFLPVDREAYEEVSATVMDVLRSSGAVVEVLGWDEAFLGVDFAIPRPSRGRSRPGAGPAAAGLHGGDRREQAQARSPPGRQAAGVFGPTSADWFLVLGDRPTDASWASRQDGQEAGRARHQHGQRPRRPTRTRWPWFRADDGAVAGAAGRGPRQRGRGRLAVRGPRARQEDTFSRTSRDGPRCRPRRGSRGRWRWTWSRTRGRRRVVVKARYDVVITETHGATLPPPTARRRCDRGGGSAAPERFTGRRPAPLLGVRAEFGTLAGGLRSLRELRGCSA